MYSPLRAGGFSHDDGWFIAPPIFSFPSRRKRENGPCTVQKRKGSIALRGTGDGGTRRRCFLRVRMSPARGVVRAGVWWLPNGRSSLFAAAYLAQGGSLPKMAASGALPLIWHAPKKKSGRRDSPATTGMRQQKEELVHSSRDKPPLNLIARGKSFRLRRSFSRAPAASPVTSFSLLDRARPVFSFSSGKKKRKWGVQRTSHLHG